jgi:uncharacterized protein (TIGR04141 family)
LPLRDYRQVGLCGDLIQDYVDYSFPFETAKRLIANNFKEADVREFLGPRTSRTETYRQGYSIARSESFGKVWKRLVARLDLKLLSKESYLRAIIDLDRPPILEVKSAFVMRKSLDLPQVIKIMRELEDLPEPTPQQLRELSFLDNLYPVKSKELEVLLNWKLVEDLRLAIVDGNGVDLDVCDPQDVAHYHGGSDFKISRWALHGDPPEIDDVIELLREKLAKEVAISDKFHEKVASMRLSYLPFEDDESSKVALELTKFLHGQLEFDGQTFFLIDKVWYRSQGDFLANLKKDFIEETFGSAHPILIREGLGVREWLSGDEGAYNRNQAADDGFYFGDKIFARTSRGKVELFDLLKVDREAKALYVIHVKDNFDAKMRDACSQISVSAEVIESDIKNNKVVLSSYYEDWAESEINKDKGATREEFLSWFDLDNIVYVVLAATVEKFTPDSFEKDKLSSHIARREVIATRNEFKGRGFTFRLAHTKRGRATLDSEATSRSSE